MEFEKVRVHIMQRIEAELPRNLYYHCYEHVQDVYCSAMNLAEMEGVVGNELTLLKTAVLFHDSGFIKGMNNHEEVGCGIARETLPEYGYTEDQINAICGMIMATRIPQSPKNKLEEIICDADLDYLGRDDFWTIAPNLFRELRELGLLDSEQDWNRLQLKFLSGHRYFTVSAKGLRQAKKEAHLNKIKSIVESYT